MAFNDVDFGFTVMHHEFTSTLRPRLHYLHVTTYTTRKNLLRTSPRSSATSSLPRNLSANTYKNNAAHGRLIRHNIRHSLKLYGGKMAEGIGWEW